MDYFDLGAYGRAITTNSPAAQTWFNRGLNWTFAYNHGEAVSCFKQALQADPECAMAHWGFAYAVGPNYNLPWHRLDPWRWPMTRHNAHWPAAPASRQSKKP